MRSSLKLNIQSILIHMTDDRTKDLIDFLILKGVKKEKDLRRITLAALEEHLSDFVDASDLHEEWQICYGKCWWLSASYSIYSNIEGNRRPSVSHMSRHDSLMTNSQLYFHEPP